jgi:hypothetical protein
VTQAFGDAAVHHHHPSRAGDHEVLGFDVPVHQARRVDRLETGQKLERDIPGLGQIERRPRAQDLPQGDTVDVLHRHQLPTVELD